MCWCKCRDPPSGCCRLTEVLKVHGISHDHVLPADTAFTAILAIGSNAAPEQLARKFPNTMFPSGVVIPVSGSTSGNTLTCTTLVHGTMMLAAVTGIKLPPCHVCDHIVAGVLLSQHAT